MTHPGEGENVSADVGFISACSGLMYSKVPIRPKTSDVRRPAGITSTAAAS